ncbi:MAG: hypothetical protein ACE14M_01140 [Terriglobales bacterium]
MPQQLTRLLIVFGVLITGLFAARYKLTPKTFGQKGHYRAVALETVKAAPVRYAGREACETCHSEIFNTHSTGHHQTVACEVCHGPAAAHTESPTENQLPAPRKRGYCPLCHGYNPSRPTGFPQIDPQTHNPVKPCITCHNPHRPEPPHVPTECSACHAQIARTKAVSRHALLACTQCHQTPVKHKVTPALFRPEKPRTRAFCGRCHAKDANSPKEIPRVDIETHGGGRYLCWQCHYPHLPEGS